MNELIYFNKTHQLLMTLMTF